MGDLLLLARLSSLSYLIVLTIAVVVIVIDFIPIAPIRIFISPIAFVWNWGKNDAIVFLYYDDRCKVFLSRSNICSTGYADGYKTYVNVKQPGADSLIKAYHKTPAYITGFQTGRANGNASFCCI